jgi:hypothetical protein
LVVRLPWLLPILRKGLIPLLYQLASLYCLLTGLVVYSLQKIFQFDHVVNIVAEPVSLGGALVIAIAVFG